MKDSFTKLQERCREFERPDATLVNAWWWTEPDGEEVMVRITKHEAADAGMRTMTVYTMTCSFMVNGGAMCSVDVQGGTAEDVFDKLAMRMIGA